MKTKLLSFQKQPFPFEKPLLLIVLSALAVGVFVSLFLLIFQPFGVGSYIKAGRTWIIGGYGLVTFLLLLFDMLLLPKILPGIFNETAWNSFREIGFQFWHIVSIGTGNVLYTRFIVKEEITILTVLNFFIVTLSIGFFPIVLGVFSTHSFLLKKYLESTKKLNDQIASGDGRRKESPGKSGRVVIASENGKEKVEVDLHDLLFIKSIENYIEVHRIQRDKIDTILLRSTLKKIEHDLKMYPFLFRCHRTYLVNVNAISKITGNSQGYKILFSLTDASIPVSRGCSKKFSKLISRPAF